MSNELSMLSAVELIQRYEAHSLSPVEVARAVFERIGKANGPVNAFVYTLEGSALAEAKESEARWKKRAPLGPIDGVPVTIKDLADIKGHPSYKGSRTTADTPVPADSPAVALMRASGAVFIGKTTTPEFGWAGVTHCPKTGITRNPWNPAKTSGGSSGGAGVAAALGMGRCDGAGGKRRGVGHHQHGVERQCRHHAAPIRDGASRDNRDFDAIGHLRNQRQRSGERVLGRPEKRWPVTARFEAGRDNRIEPRLFQSLGFLDCRGRADGEDPSLAAGLQNILRGNPEHKAGDRRFRLKQSFNLRRVILREPRRRFRCLDAEFAIIRR